MRTNKTLKSLNNVDPFAPTKEEKDLLYKIGAMQQFKYPCERTQYLETIYEKLHDRKNDDVKEVTEDYCSRFLHYGDAEIENITKK